MEVAQGDLCPYYYTLSHLLILHPKWELLLVAGPVWEDDHCTQALPGTFTAWWHRLCSRAWEGSLAGFQLTDLFQTYS